MARCRLWKRASGAHELGMAPVLVVPVLDTPKTVLHRARARRTPVNGDPRDLLYPYLVPMDVSNKKRWFLTLVDTPTPSSPSLGGSPAMQRKKLTLLPRSEHPLEPSPMTPQTDEGRSKSNPFGAAKPVDTDSALKKVEEKLAKEREHKDELASTKSTTSNPSQTPTNPPRHEKSRSNPKQLLRRSPANPASQAAGSSEIDPATTVKAEAQNEAISEGVESSWRRTENDINTSPPDEPGWETVPSRGKKPNGVGPRH